MLNVQVFDLDCVSEDIPRFLFVVTKGQVSRPSALFESLADEKGFSVYALGLGPTSNYYVV